MSRFSKAITVPSGLATFKTFIWKTDSEKEPKIVPTVTLTLCFEAVTTKTLRILGFPDSPNLYNSFGTLLVCFNDLTNKWQKLFSKLECSVHQGVFSTSGGVQYIGGIP